MDYGRAVKYPTRGENAFKTILIGGGVMVLSFLLSFVAPLNLPFQFVVLGYVVLVIGSTIDGDTEPPAFEDVGRLLKKGLVVFGIQFAYFLLMMVVFVVLMTVVMGVFFLLSVVGIGVGAGAGGETGGGIAAIVATIGTFGVTVLFSLFGFLGFVLVGYLFPISVCIYADTDDLGEAFSLGRLKRVGASADYAVPWLVAGVGGSLVGFVIFPLNLLLVGFFLQFAVTVAAARIVALGYAEAEGIDVGAAAGRGRPAEAAGAGGGTPTAGGEGSVRDEW